METDENSSTPIYIFFVEDQHLSHPCQLVVLTPTWKNVPSPAEAAPSDALPFLLIHHLLCFFWPEKYDVNKI